MRLRFLRMTAKGKVKIKVKGDGQESVGPTRAESRSKSKAAGGAPALHSLREFQAVWLAEEVPGFAVGVVGVGFAAVFGA